MQAIHLKRRLDSETLHLPQLRPMVGQDVEIVVFTTMPETTSAALSQGTTESVSSGSTSVEPAGKVVHPDFLARARAIWGDSIPGKPLSEIVSEARGDVP